MLVVIILVLLIVVVGIYLYINSDTNNINKKDNMNTKSSIQDPNAVNEAGEPIIFYAIKSMDLDRVKQLVEAGADLENTGFGDKTAAMIAAEVDQWEICLYLLQQGADATVFDHRNLTISYLAFNARIVPESHQGQYNEKVKQFLKEKGLEYLNVHPKEITELKASGNWPPVELD